MSGCRGDSHDYVLLPPHFLRPSLDRPHTEGLALPRHDFVLACPLIDPYPCGSAHFGTRLPRRFALRLRLGQLCQHLLSKLQELATPLTAVHAFIACLAIAPDWHSRVDECRVLEQPLHHRVPCWQRRFKSCFETELDFPHLDVEVSHSDFNLPIGQWVECRGVHRDGPSWWRSPRNEILLDGLGCILTVGFEPDVSLTSALDIAHHGFHEPNILRSFAFGHMRPY